MPLCNRCLFAEGEFLAGEHELIGSPSSSLQVYSLRLGATAAWPLYRHFLPYAGLFVQESRVSLEASKIGETETAWKPGLGLRAGVFVPVHSIFGLRAGVEYSAMDLSGERLEELSFTMAGMIHVPLSSMGSPDRGGDQGRAGQASDDDRADGHFRRGLEMADRGDIAGAEEAFRETLSLKGSHAGASRMLGEISAARRSYVEAKSLLAEKKYFEAIPRLEKSSLYIRAAGADLAGTRSLLAGEIPGLERRGIRAYEARDYDQCIAIMKKVQALDPENGTAKLYLPRAQSRKQAIDRLK